MTGRVNGIVHVYSLYLCVAVNGRWSEWSSYEDCTASCGGGVKIRERHCDDPPPAHGGEDCDGEDHEEEECGMDPCPSK